MAHPTVDSDLQISVRELIAELARIEDAVRSLSTYVKAADGTRVLNPALLELLDRERTVVAALRSIDLRDGVIQEGSPPCPSA